MNEFKQCLLTDIKSIRRSGEFTDIPHIKSCIDRFNMTRYHTGEWFYNKTTAKDSLKNNHNISITNVSHIIKNVKLVDDKIYGDVLFTNTDSGNTAARAYEYKNAVFVMRCDANMQQLQQGYTYPRCLQIIEILTWDCVSTLVDNDIPIMHIVDQKTLGAERSPLGLAPKFIWKEERLKSVKEAIHRYVDNHMSLPCEWVSEYNE